MKKFASQSENKASKTNYSNKSKIKKKASAWLTTPLLPELISFINST